MFQTFKSKPDSSPTPTKLFQLHQHCKQFLSRKVYKLPYFGLSTFVLLLCVACFSFDEKLPCVLVFSAVFLQQREDI